MNHPVSTSTHGKRSTGPTLEVCVDSVQSAVAAQEGGAHRIELCSGLAEGGISPSYGLIDTIRNKVSIEVCVMVRPRPGDFCYSASEISAMKQDILAAKRLGADGLVAGVLNKQGEIDVAILRELVQLARPLDVTFHRAFDVARNPLESLDQLVACGISKVLTSGQSRSAMEGRELIMKLVRSAGDRLIIVAGAGITEENVATLMKTTGVREIHAGRGVKSTPGTASQDKFTFGERSEVDAAKVRRLLSAMQSILSAN